MSKTSHSWNPLFNPTIRRIHYDNLLPPSEMMAVRYRTHNIERNPALDRKNLIYGIEGFTENMAGWLKG